MRTSGFNQAFRLVCAMAVDDELAKLGFDDSEVVDPHRNAPQPWCRSEALRGRAVQNRVLLSCVAPLLQRSFQPRPIGEPSRLVGMKEGGTEIAPCPTNSAMMAEPFTTNRPMKCTIRKPAGR